MSIYYGRIVIFITALAISCNSLATELQLVISELKPVESRVVVRVYRDAKYWFSYDPKEAVVYESIPLTPQQREVSLDIQLDPGKYAVAVFQDLNANQKVDTNFLGIPKEPTGNSSLKKSHMGPPTYNDAEIDVKGDLQKLHIKLWEY